MRFIPVPSIHLFICCILKTIHYLAEITQKSLNFFKALLYAFKYAINIYSIELLPLLCSCELMVLFVVFVFN